MTWMPVYLGRAPMLEGGILLLAVAWGVLRLPDSLARRNAGTKAGTLALVLLCVGAVVWAVEWAWSGRLAAFAVSVSHLAGGFAPVRPRGGAGVRLAQRHDTTRHDTT